MPLRNVDQNATQLYNQTAARGSDVYRSTECLLLPHLWWKLWCVTLFLLSHFLLTADLCRLFTVSHAELTVDGWSRDLRLSVIHLQA